MSVREYRLTCDGCETALPLAGYIRDVRRRAAREHDWQVATYARPDAREVFASAPDLPDHCPTCLEGGPDA
ncbi:hypothetical protein M3G03_10150 [Aestuariimicrobium sp. p3-SID1156]|uniref:hypothetical protein n=1 Tax=Aestuariimicrobium sp. p3-SID1156 TaxID=2916038 RepID=UPI00223B25A7|nr:hypothetical protein [Aestuariimicrobium sp. p3-SID1156]MCT1459892.1 hypothetical protein [Aestuariimicrobium sp. p3-SID1156]